jgi:hypothetical protein
MNEHEDGFVQSFVVKNKRDRTAMLLRSAKRRKDFLKSLAHYGDLDALYAKVILPKTAHTVEEWARLLRSKGAPANCRVISEDISRGGREYPLEDALREAIGSGMGNLLSCIPGKLCYFEDEEKQRLLER